MVNMIWRDTETEKERKNMGLVEGHNCMLANTGIDTPSLNEASILMEKQMRNK